MRDGQYRSGRVASSRRTARWKLLSAMCVVAMVGGLAALVAAPSAGAATGGNFFGTGHDMDFHCSGGDANECAYFKIIVTKARAGSSLPILALDQGSELTSALSSIGASPVTSVDPSNAAALNAKKFVDAGNHPLFSLIITASDSSCGGCDNTTAGESNINARKADFATYLDHGGNIFALTGGPSNFSTYYNFVSLSGLTGAPVSAPFTVTPDGAALGITSAQANCCATHSSFKIPPSPPFKTLEKDSAGLAETIDCLGCTSAELSGGGGSPRGTIFETTFKRCNTLHVGYNRFKDGTVVNWNVTTNGVGTVASGHFTAIGGGKLGSKTYHFLDIPLGTTLPSEASGIQSHMHFHWANGGSYAATRDSGC